MSIDIIKPGYFSKQVSADSRRMAFDFANESIVYSQKRPYIVFLGDSITDLWELYAYFDNGKFLVNRGICGDTSKYLAIRFDADCIQLKPKKAIVMIGINNISRCQEDVWWHQKGEDKEVVLEEYKQDILQMVEKCEKNSIELILCSVTPSKIAPPNDREILWDMTAKMNEFLKGLGKTYVDYTSVLSTDGKTILDEYSPDGIHPNALGYVQMAKKLKEVIDI